MQSHLSQKGQEAPRGGRAGEAGQLLLPPGVGGAQQSWHSCSQSPALCRQLQVTQAQTCCQGCACKAGKAKSWQGSLCCELASRSPTQGGLQGPCGHVHGEQHAHMRAAGCVCQCVHRPGAEGRAHAQQRGSASCPSSRPPPWGQSGLHICIQLRSVKLGIHPSWG